MFFVITGNKFSIWYVFFNALVWIPRQSSRKAALHRSWCCFPLPLLDKKIGEVNIDQDWILAKSKEFDNNAIEEEDVETPDQPDMSVELPDTIPYFELPSRCRKIRFYIHVYSTSLL